MATARTKKPTTKLAASKTKKSNKWLIAGGIIAVGICGVVIVRFSSAANWKPLQADKVNTSVTTLAYIYSPDYRGTQAGTYHVCFTGYSTGASSSTAIITYNQRRREVRFKTTASKQCSYAANFTNPLLDGGSMGDMKKLHGANIKITETSIEKLR